MAAFNAYGVGSANGVGASVFAGVFSAGGASAASAVGRQGIQGQGATAGIATVAAAGRRARQGQGVAAGVASSSVKGRTARLGVGAASGVSVVAGTGSAIRRSVGASSGIGAIAAVGAPAGNFAVSGIATTNAQPSTIIGVSDGVSSVTGKLSAVNVTAAGVGTASALSKSLRSGAGVSQSLSVAVGIGDVSWASRADADEALFASHGLTFVQTGHATDDVSAQTAVCASSGVVSSTTDLLEKRRSVAVSAGTSVARSYTELVETKQSAGSASASGQVGIRATAASVGAANNTVVVVQRTFVVGQSVGAASATAKAVGARSGVGEAVGASSTTWVGRAVRSAAAASAGAASVQGSVVGSARLVGVAAGAGSAAGVRGGRQQETLVSVGEVEDFVLLPVPAVYPAFWSNTIRTSGATWEGLPFNSMIEVDGVVYAASVSGLSKMEDLSDDNGSPVLTKVEWDLADRSDYKQRARSVYIHASADGPFTVKVGNKQGEFSYQTHLPASSKPMNHRAAIGRGIASRAMRLSLQHDRYFAAGDVNLESGDTTRRI